VEGAVLTVGARLPPITSVCLPARRASSLQVSLLKGTVSVVNTLSGDSSLRLHILEATFPGRGRGGDFCWETRRAPPLALTAFNGERVRCEENNEEQPQQMLLLSR